MNADEVYQEVERRKERARKLGVDTLIKNLYFNAIQYYPSWIKKDKDYVCSLVSKAIELGEEKTNDIEWEKIEITLKNKEYVFAFEKHDIYLPDDTAIHGTLELYDNNQKVIGLKLSCDLDEYGSEWSAFDINAFIEGKWIQDFKDLQNKIEIEAREKEKKEREDPKKIDDLKKNFGI